MRLLPDNLHKMVLSYKDRLPGTNLCESRMSNLLLKKRFRIFNVTISYYCRFSFNSKIEYFRSNKDYDLVCNETML